MSGNGFESYQVAACYVISDLSRATGGVSYQRQHTSTEHNGEALTTNFETVKHVDNLALVTEGNQILSQARYALRRYATPTPIGHVATEAQLILLRAEMDDLADKAANYNTRAAAVGSLHRVRAAICPIKIDLDNESAAIEIAATVGSTLMDVLGYLQAGDFKRLRGLLDTKARNLHRLVVGLLADSVRDALDAARLGRSVIAKNFKGGGAVADLDLSDYTDPIEAAIGLLTSVDDLGAADDGPADDDDGQPAQLVLCA